MKKYSFRKYFDWFDFNCRRLFEIIFDTHHLSYSWGGEGIPSLTVTPHKESYSLAKFNIQNSNQTTQEKTRFYE